MDIVHPLGVNINNLTQIKTRREEIRHGNDKPTMISLFNAQSICNKEDMILDHLLHYKVDLGIITETWMTEDNESDKIWLQLTDINKTQYCFSSCARKARRGGGLGLVSRKSLQVKLVDSRECSTFQVAKWNIGVEKLVLTVIGVYKPPNMSNSIFLEEFTEWIGLCIASDHNIIVAGDFNLHVNKLQSEDDAGNFVDMMITLGLDQKVNFPTHKSGNTLDLIFTEFITGIEITKCQVTTYISDHCAILCATLVKKPEMCKNTIVYRRTDSINYELFADRLKRSMDWGENSLDILVDNFNKHLSTILDEVAPECSKTVTQRMKVPRFMEEVRMLKHKLQRREKYGESMAHTNTG